MTTSHSVKLLSNIGGLQTANCNQAYQSIREVYNLVLPIQRNKDNQHLNKLGKCTVMLLSPPALLKFPLGTDDQSSSSIMSVPI